MSLDMDKKYMELIVSEERFALTNACKIARL